MISEGVTESINPWEREPLEDEDYYTSDLAYYLDNLVETHPKFSQKDVNKYLDIHTKRAALKVSPSIVALVSYTGEKELNQCSGTIIEVDDSNVAIVLTSANLIWQEKVSHSHVADSVKVIVLTSEGESSIGEICAHDFHYNILFIRFTKNSPIQSAILRHVDDSINLNPQINAFENTSFQLRSHSSSFKLVPGEAVIAVGRYFAKPFDLMAAPGEFCLDRCEYDCKELFMVTCRMTRCGDGGSIINVSGEVIGIGFYHNYSTPFMPINIALKWWEHYKRYGVCRRPYMGVEATNFYICDLDIAEKIFQSCPSISRGVVVEKVISGSSADSAGLRVNDVIIQCSGKVVQSFLELFELIWDNVGNDVELLVVRADVTPLRLKMMVVDATEDELYSWSR